MSRNHAPVLLVLIVLALLVGPATSAVAQEQLVDPGTVARRLVSLVGEDGQVTDGDAFDAAATAPHVDPWTVADTLVLGGRPDVAAVLAVRLEGPDFAKLAAYVERVRTVPREQLRERVERLNRAVMPAMRGDWAAAAVNLEGIELLDQPDLTNLRAVGVRAMSLEETARHAEAYELYLALGEAGVELGWLVAAQEDYGKAAGIMVGLGRLSEARAAMEGSLTVAELRGDPGSIGMARASLGSLLIQLRQVDEGRAVLAEALAYLEAEGVEEELSGALINGANAWVALGRMADARPMLVRGLELAREHGRARWEANALGGLHVVEYAIGTPERALEIGEEARAALARVQDMPGVARANIVLGATLARLERYRDAQRALARGESLARLVRNENLVAQLAYVRGLIALGLDDYDTAVAQLDAATATWEAIGHQGLVLHATERLADAHLLAGRYSRALVAYDRTIELARLHHRPDAADDLCIRKADALVTLGELVRAEQVLAPVLERTRSDLPPALALQLALVSAELALAAEDYDEARERAEAGLVAAKGFGPQVPGDLVSRLTAQAATAHAALGDLDAALQSAERALAIARERGNPAVTAERLSELGAYHLAGGDASRAAALHREAVTVALEGSHWGVIAAAHAHLAESLLATGDSAGAVEAARASLEYGDRAAFGLGLQEGVAARGRLTRRADQVGLSAALALGDDEQALFFLERGRAGALVEAIRARDALWAAAVPARLRERAAIARAEERRATLAMQRAREEGALEALRAARAEWEEASVQVAEVDAAIQREAKAAAEIVRPSPATAAGIQAQLAAGDVLVAYHVGPVEAVAFVLTSDALRVVALGKAEAVAKAAVALELHSRDGDTGPALARLRRLLVEPLVLPKTTARLIVSPDGPLASVAFAAVVPDLPLTYTPSGTTLVLLAEASAAEGAGVLALGDPDYSTLEGDVVARHRGRGGRLAPLPGTRAEVEAVGTVRLLGADASETGLRAELEQDRRWRSVHLACHGLVDLRHPERSALAVTADEEHDGFLTALEVFGLALDADMAVLSACETGRGREVGGEGLVGLTRSFLVAGTPRVLCSLWKVDDAATSALMVRFYELWSPEERDGVEPAVALRRAQAHVAAQEGWSHPYFWAAWSLWGSPR